MSTPDKHGWRSMESAPKDGTPFLALNEDREVHVAAFDEHGRLMRRSHQQRFPQTFVTNSSGQKILTEEGFEFCTDWSFWTRGYEFKPTHWQPLPPPPEDS